MYVNVYIYSVYIPASHIVLGCTMSPADGLSTSPADCGEAQDPLCARRGPGTKNPTYSFAVHQAGGVDHQRDQCDPETVGNSW